MYGDGEGLLARFGEVVVRAMDAGKLVARSFQHCLERRRSVFRPPSQIVYPMLYGVKLRSRARFSFEGIDRLRLVVLLDVVLILLGKLREGDRNLAAGFLLIVTLSPSLLTKAASIAKLPVASCHVRSFGPVEAGPAVSSAAASPSSLASARRFSMAAICGSSHTRSCGSSCLARLCIAAEALLAANRGPNVLAPPRAKPFPQVQEGDRGLFGDGSHFLQGRGGHPPCRGELRRDRLRGGLALEVLTQGPHGRVGTRNSGCGWP